MDEVEFVTSLFPELPRPVERWEVTFTRHYGGDGPVVPCAPAVSGVIAMYQAVKAEAITVVEGPQDGAEAAARELCAGMPWVAGAGAEVRPAGTSIRRIPLAD